MALGAQGRLPHLPHIRNEAACFICKLVGIKKCAVFDSWGNIILWTMAFLYKLIFRKIIKIDATRCQILGPKCTKSFVGWRSVPDLPPPDTLAGFKGAYFYA